MSVLLDELAAREPDYSQLDAVFHRHVPQRVPLIELFADHEFMVAMLGCDANQMFADTEYEDWQKYWLWRIEYQQRIGADFVTAAPGTLGYAERKVLMSADTAPLARPERCWVDESQGVINSWDDFAKYPWLTDPPDMGIVDFVAENVPPGMGVIFTSSGVLEWTMWLMGYEPLSLALHDDPNLVRAVSQRVGQRFLDGYAAAAKHSGVHAIWLGDDMGFKTATMISPDHMRELIFPWHKRIAEAAHAEGKPFLLHACGNLEAVMEDLIEDVRIDAKHSFEDAIMPVAEFKDKYGDRIAVLGGADVDYLSRHSPEEVRRYVRAILEACAPGGGYAMGTGNSVANYIPVNNYLALLDELRQYNGA